MLNIGNVTIILDICYKIYNILKYWKTKKYKEENQNGIQKRDKERRKKNKYEYVIDFFKKKTEYVIDLTCCLVERCLRI